MNIRNTIASIVALLLFALSANCAESALFEKEGDIGQPSHAGSTIFEPGGHSFVIAGGGENMWFTNDAFHFVWTRVSGDFSLQAAIEWLGTGGNPHRKACLVARQSLAPNSPYVDVAVHGDGLITLQYRETQGGPTREIQAVMAQASRRAVSERVALERRGEAFFV